MKLASQKSLLTSGSAIFFPSFPRGGGFSLMPFENIVHYNVQILRLLFVVWFSIEVFSCLVDINRWSGRNLCRRLRGYRCNRCCRCGCGLGMGSRDCLSCPFCRSGRRSLSGGVAPTVYRSQMCRHVVFPVEFLVANRARIWFPVQMGSDIMPVEVGRVGVWIVADFAAVSISLLGAIRPDADGRISGRTGTGTAGSDGAGGIRAVGPDRTLRRRAVRTAKKGLAGGKEISGIFGVFRHRRRRIQQSRRWVGVVVRNRWRFLHQSVLSVQSVDQPLLPELLHVDLRFAENRTAGLLFTAKAGGSRQFSAGGFPPVFALHTQVLGLVFRCRIGQLNGRSGGLWRTVVFRSSVRTGGIVPVHKQPLLGHLANSYCGGKQGLNFRAKKPGFGKIKSKLNITNP